MLEARAPGSDWQTVCVPPCTRRLDARATYRFGGEGVVASSPFVLPAGAEHVAVDATMGSPLLRDVGTVLAVGGFVFVAGGGTILLLPSSGGDRSARDVVGAGFLVGGALVLAAGILGRILADTSVEVRTPAVAP